MTVSIRSLMAPPIPSVHSADSIVTAARKLRAHAVDAVLVRGDHDEFLGIISRGTIIDECVADGADPAAMTAGELVGSPGPFAGPDQDAGSSVIEVILRHRASFLPVVEQGRLIGIITLDAIAGELVGSIDDLEVDDSGFDDSGFDGSAFNDTAFDDSGDFEDPAVPGSAPAPVSEGLRATHTPPREQLRRRAL